MRFTALLETRLNPGTRDKGGSGGSRGLEGTRVIGDISRDMR